MADQAEKTVALKKAYAEIILNTAKEAAARVMVSERKALRFEHDLCNTKDEAIRMLLRLKQMIDEKTTEAELTCSGQQKRIEELDAQLNEAEGVIIDLREELRNAYNQLEEAKNSHMQQSNEPLKNEQFIFSTQCGTFCNQKETATSNPRLNDVFINNPSLASIIIGSKEPELYRNGCTHRIRAIERNLLDTKKPSLEICTEKELIINEDEQNSGKYDPSSINAENTGTQNLNVAEDLSIFAKDQPVEARILARSSVKSSESNPKLSRFCYDQPIKPTTETDKLPENNERSACNLRRSIRKRKVRCWDDISSLFKSRGALFRCKKSEEHQYKSKSMAEMNQIIVPITPSKNTSEGTENDELSMVEKHEVSAKESSGVSSFNIIIEADKVPKTDSVLAECNSGAASDTDKNKLLKYTFSRKRKRDLSLKSDNLSSLGKKPDLIEDPSSDNQNMVEVACQLISLAGEHRW